MLLVVWAAALLGSGTVVLIVDLAAGDTGTLRIVGLAIVYSIAGWALKMIRRV